MPNNCKCDRTFTICASCFVVVCLSHFRRSPLPWSGWSLSVLSNRVRWDHLHEFDIYIGEDGKVIILSCRPSSLCHFFPHEFYRLFCFHGDAVCRHSEVKDSHCLIFCHCHSFIQLNVQRHSNTGQVHIYERFKTCSSWRTCVCVCVCSGLVLKKHSHSEHLDTHAELLNALMERNCLKLLWIHSFFCSFIHLFNIFFFVHSFIDLIIHSFDCSSICSFIHLLISLFVCLFILIHSFPQSLINLFVHSWVGLLVSWLVGWFIHSLVGLLVQ